MPLGELCNRATAAFAELAGARRIEVDEDPASVGGVMVALTLRLAGLHLAKGLGLVVASGLEGLTELAAHDLYRTETPFEGLDASVVACVRETLAPFEGAPVEALGAAYELLVGHGFERAAAPIAVASGVAIDLASVLALPSGDRATHVAEILGEPIGRRASRALARASGPLDAAEALGARAVVPPGGLVVTSSLARRRAGSHYTPAELADLVATAALEPLFATREPGDLRVCDPAMGAGAILFAAARVLETAGASREIIVRSCLFGIDRDPLAVAVARFGAWLFAGAAGPPPPELGRHLAFGDAVLDDATLFHVRTAASRFLRVSVAFPEIAARGGFDAVIGNPPWVAYVGRAAQPLGDDERRFYQRTYRAFAGYRTLHGIFVERSAQIARPGGRIGLVLPTSVADLAGYAKTRAAHDALAKVDEGLLDFGADRFEGVFQPAMALLSTRRATDTRGSDAPWVLASGALPPDEAKLVARLAALPPLPPELFGERGIQTEGEDVDHLVEAAAPAPPFTFSVREGRDVAPFAARAPRVHLDPRKVRANLKTPALFAEVTLLIRQTARYPMAALGDGAPFRNSVLAAFAHPAIDAFALLAYLNGSAVRWLHFVRFRDARQGMPQLKIGHLRAIPTPPKLAEVGARLTAVGKKLGRRNQGIGESEQTGLDALVAEALALDDAEAAIVERFRRANPPPVGRR